jgi:hypothetical protein
MKPRASGPRSLAASLPEAAKRTLRHHGFAEAGIVTDWPAIVGEALAAHSTPLRLGFPPGKRLEGTLHVSVSGALALELQHLEPLVLERINGYFGYRAVGHLKLVHDGRKPALPPDVTARPARDGAAPPPALPPGIEDIEDPALRQALERLGRAVQTAGERGGKG